MAWFSLCAAAVRTACGQHEASLRRSSCWLSAVIQEQSLPTGTRIHAWRG